MRLFGIIVLTAASLSAAPVITGVTNAASTLPPGLTNSGVAQGSMFTIYGLGLGPSTLLKAETYPLQTTQGLGGTTVQVTVGGVTETCIMIYTLATQVAAILPSPTPTGTGTVTVSYQGTSGSGSIEVVSATFGAFTLNEGGSGPAVITDGNNNAITMVNPAYPGETLVLWGTGLGPISGNETEPPVQVDLGTGVQVFVENQPATVVYGGRGSSAGLDQINFTVPLGISGGCRTSVAVMLKGIVGNVTSMAIAPQGQSTCGDTYGILTSANLQKAVATGTLNVAEVALTRFGTENDVLTANFLSYPLNSLLQSYGGSDGPSLGSCNAYEIQGSSLIITDPTQPPRLDAGPSLTITGPNGTNIATASSTGSYPATLGTSSSPYIVPGAYTVSNGSGGANVAGFSLSQTLPAPIAFTNFPATVTRSQGVTLTWTNSSAFSVVSINGYAGVPLSSTNTAYVEFFCAAPASAGQFTIPSVILSLLPTNGYGAFGELGVGIQIAGLALNSFTVAGSPGIDTGLFSVFTATGGVAAVQ
jgi:uncharacterized protein (TIGR03437 family)